MPGRVHPRPLATALVTIAIQAGCTRAQMSWLTSTTRAGERWSAILEITG